MKTLLCLIALLLLACGADAQTFNIVGANETLSGTLNVAGAFTGANATLSGGQTNTGPMKASTYYGDLSGGTGLTASQIPSLDASKITTDPLPYLVTADNNTTNYVINRANGWRQIIVANNDVHISHFTNSAGANANGHVTLFLKLTNSVSPIVSMPTNWDWGNTNGLALVSGFYSMTITNNGHKTGIVDMDGTGAGTSQTNVVAMVAGGAP